MPSKPLRLGLAVLAIGVVLAPVVWHLLARSVRFPQPLPRETGESWTWPARPKVFVQDYARSENVHDSYARDVKSRLDKGLRAQDWSLAREALTEDFRGGFPAPEAGTRALNRGAVIHDYSEPAPADLDRDAFVAVLRDHQEGWTHVERTTWRTFEFLLDPDGQRAWIRLHFQIAGPVTSDGRVDVQAVLSGEVRRSGETWKVRRLALERGCRIEFEASPHVDVTDAVGFHFNESEENRKLSQATINARAQKFTGGLSAIDFNGDGFWDLLASSINRPSVLFQNDGHGGLHRVPAPGAEDRGVAHFLLADLDGNGTLEAVGTDVTGFENGEAELSLYTATPDGWRRVPGALRFQVPLTVRRVENYCLVACDVDRDRRLDIFVGGYSTNLSGQQEFNTIAAYDGCDNLLFMNRGELRFTEESGPRGLRGTQYTLAAKFFDLDGDGDEDLYELNDFGPAILWVNDGKGNFQELRGHPLAVDAAYHMGITIADWDNTGDWSLYVSNMYSHAGNRIVPLASAIGEELRNTALVIARGNQMFERPGATGAWQETASARETSWADWAWSCNFYDIDNDGDRDLFVTNGYTSHEDASAPDW